MNAKRKVLSAACLGLLIACMTASAETPEEKGLAIAQEVDRRGSARNRGTRFQCRRETLSGRGLPSRIRMTLEVLTSQHVEFPAFV